MPPLNIHNVDFWSTSCSAICPSQLELRRCLRQFGQVCVVRMRCCKTEVCFTLAAGSDVTGNPTLSCNALRNDMFTAQCATKLNQFRGMSK